LGCGAQTQSELPVCHTSSPFDCNKSFFLLKSQVMLFNPRSNVITPVYSLMPRLHMQVWQPGTEREALYKRIFVLLRSRNIWVFEEDRKPS